MDASLRPNATPWRLSWDAILFTLLCLAQFWSNQVAVMVPPSKANNVSLIVHLTHIFYYDPFPGLLLLVLILYIGADLWIKGRLGFIMKFIALIVIITAFVILPTMAAIVFRQNTAPHLYIHDGAIQIEEAIKFLLAGKNPYSESYANTPMEQWPFNEPGIDHNPALDHLIYLPFVIIFSTPFYWLSQTAVGWYDQRLVYLGMLLALLLILVRLKSRSPEKLAMTMVVALNPLFVPFFIEGRNDIVVLFWLIGALYFLQQRRWSWAGVWIAAAAASKQTAWFMLPFFVLFVLNPAQRQHWRDLLPRARMLIPALGLFMLIVTPFVLWDVPAFVGDVINYQSGISPSTTNYPIKSLGLGSFVLGFGWVESSAAAFPFSIFQIVFGGLALVVLLIYQWRHNTIAQMVLNYALLFFVFAFFSRTFNDNHLGFVLTCLVLSVFLDSTNVSQNQ